MPIDVIGLKEANAALRKLPEFAKRRAQQEIDITAFQFVRMAQGKVRVRTGFLQQRIEWLSRPRSVSAVVGIDDAHYWKFLEYGTVRMSAHPFLRPTADALNPDHDRRMMRALAAAADDVERAGARLL